MAGSRYGGASSYRSNRNRIGFNGALYLLSPWRMTRVTLATTGISQLASPPDIFNTRTEPLPPSADGLLDGDVPVGLDLSLDCGDLQSVSRASFCRFVSYQRSNDS